MALSQKDLEGLFKEIVEWARQQGCRVYCHWKKKTVNGSNGYFAASPVPHIRMGLLDRPIKRSLVLLLHEFCHFWQWKDGFLGRKDDLGNQIYTRILNGEEVTPAERERARKLVAYSEYDCERRTAYLLKKWKLEEIISSKDYVRSANTYNRHVAWSIGDAQKPGSGVFFPDYDKCAEDLWGRQKSRWLTNSQVVAPINQKHAQVFEKALQRFRKKKRS